MRTYSGLMNQLNALNFDLSLIISYKPYFNGTHIMINFAWESKEENYNNIVNIYKAQFTN